MDDLLAAEEQLEQAWCELDAEWHRLLQEAAADAARIVEEAEGEAAAILLEAEERADRIVAEARRSTAAAPPVAAPLEDPTGIREALQRLRSELSHVVDAALDAFPTIESTAALFADPAAAPAAADSVEEHQVDDEPLIDLTAGDGVTLVIAPRPGRLRRLLRLSR